MWHLLNRVLFILFVCLPQLPELEALKARIKAIEDQGQTTVASILGRINKLAIRPPADFDKYEALSLAQELVRVATIENHGKAAVYGASLEEIHSRLERPAPQFKAYFLALFADKGFANIIQSLAKVDKALGSAPHTTSRRQPNYSGGANRQVVCYRCGRPGHFANRCYARQFQPNRSPRFAPYQRFPPKNN